MFNLRFRPATLSVYDLSHRHLCPLPPPVAFSMLSTTDTCTKRRSLCSFTPSPRSTATHTLSALHLLGRTAAVQPVADFAGEGLHPCGRDNGPCSAESFTGLGGWTVMWQRVGSCRVQRLCSCPWI